MTINMLLHEEINNYVTSTKEQDIYKELDKMQMEFNVLNRITRDLLHLIELGENLSVADKVTLFEELRAVREERRYIKNMLKFYMNKDFYSRLESNGTIGRGNKVYRPLDRVYESDRENYRLYALRTSNESSRIEDLIKSMNKWESKFAKIATDVSEEDMEEIKCRN